jgi:coenzyme F420-reducing hydrogenase delta subunit
MCSARVDLAHIFRAFSHGLDGVFIGGCHLNDCHYITNGNYNALGMVTLCTKLLERLGINPARLRLEWVSAGEGIRFANIMNDFAPRIQKLGPLGSSEGIDEKTLRFRLDTAAKLIPYIKLVERERLRAPLKLRFSSEPEQEYDKFFNSEETMKLFDDTIISKLVISQITSLLREGPLSTGEISRALGLGASEVSRQLNISSRQGLVRYDADLKGFVAA